MGDFFVEAPIKSLEIIEGDQVRFEFVPDVDFTPEGFVEVFRLAKGTPEEFIVWHVNGSIVDQAKVDVEKAKGRMGFEKGKPDPASRLQRAIDASHSFAEG